MIRTLRLAVLVLAPLIGSVASLHGQARVEPDRLLTEPDPAPYYAGYVPSPLTPIWDRGSWLVVWGEARAVGGARAQRLSPQGDVLWSPDRQISPHYPYSFVPFGSGFLVGSREKSYALDHDLQPHDFLSRPLAHLASNGNEALGWTFDLKSISLARTGPELQHLAPRSIIGESNPRSIPVGVAGSDTFLLAWTESFPWNGTLRWNLIRTDGSIVLEQPAIGTSPETQTTSIAAAWTGERYVLVWTTWRDGLSDLHLMTIEQDGSSGPSSLFGTIDNYRGALQLVPVSPSRFVLAWWTSVHGSFTESTVGMFLDDPASEPFLIANRPTKIGSDRQGNLALATENPAAVRMVSVESPGIVRDLSDWIPVARATRDRARIETTESSPVAVWSEGTYPNVTLVAGRLDEARSRLIRTFSLAEKFTGSAALAYSSGKHLVVWSREGQEAFELTGRLLTDLGVPVTPEIQIGQGYLPELVKSGSGWLVRWQTFEGRAMFRSLGPDGWPAGPPKHFAEPVRGEGQNWARLEALADGETFAAWQEGEFFYDCRILCPTYPPGVIRTVRIDEDGAVVEESTHTYEIEGRLGRPSLSSNGTTILLTWIAQTANGYELQGNVLDSDGERIAGPFSISTEVGQSLDEPPTLLAMKEGFLVVWPGYDASRGAIVREAETGSPTVELFEISSDDYLRGVSVLRTSPWTAFVMYDRPAPEPGYGGTRQIAGREVHVDGPPRRRTVRR